MEILNKLLPAHSNLKQGCPSCGHIKKNNGRVTSTKWIKHAIKTHGNMYDYSKVRYIDSYTPVVIICKIHGEFKQIPTTHLSSKCGCPDCGLIKNSNNRAYTVETFKEKANKRHNNVYDYSLVEYNRSSDIIKIICPYHGVFNQVAREHLRNGCPECGNENKGRYTESYFINNPEKKNISCKLYSLKFTHKESSETFYKIGVTINSIKKRFKLDNVRYDIEILDIEQDTLWNCFKKRATIIKRDY